MVVFLPVISVHMPNGQNLPLAEQELFILRATRRKNRILMNHQFFACRLMLETIETKKLLRDRRIHA